MKRRSVIAFALTTGTLIALGSPAMAATTHYDYPEACYDVGGGQTACYSTSGHYNATQTPSGNYIYAGQGASTYSITDAYGVKLYSTAYEYKYNFLVKDGVTQVSRSLYNSEFTQQGQTCQARDNFIFANGEARHDKFEISCT
jgi:hypothetical protein